MVKLCAFDLDGTLVNTLQDITDSLNYALQECVTGRCLDPALCRPSRSARVSATLAAALAGLFPRFTVRRES